MLLFDIGNSLVKVVVVESGNISAQMSFFRDGSFLALLEKWLSSFKAVGCGYIASVVPDLCTEVCGIIEKSGIKPVIITQKGHNVIPVKVDYPDKVGIDRLLAARAAWEFEKKGVIVVDAGTAVTVDYVDENGVFQGGAIMPGRKLWLKSLSLNTAQLPLIDLDSSAKTPVGKNTEEAILAGVSFGFFGAVNNLIKEQLKISGEKTRVVVSGGDYSFLKNNIDFPHTFLSHLVFDGMMAVVGKMAEQ